MDTEWTYIREPIETNSMVLKGLLPETEYQFVIRAVNMHGASPPSPINSPVRTLSKSVAIQFSSSSGRLLPMSRAGRVYVCFCAARVKPQSKAVTYFITCDVGGALGEGAPC